MRIRILFIFTLFGIISHCAAVAQDSAAVATIDTVPPLVRNLDRPFDVTNGLEGRHIALWGSHGLYYEMGNARWEWQRARMFQAVEDKFPTSFVLKYLTPMLENAGAVVMMPRERDTNPNEVVVDNDGKLATSPYSETNGHHHWQTGKGKGFALDRTEYADGANPFEQGTFREARCVTDSAQRSTIVWTPDIADDGNYAVYVSYKSLENSTTDAHYTVCHKGGKTSFAVNQQMGGGTWIYLGTFAFGKGQSGRIVLDNLSSDSDAVVTADAVRVGGGMGNIARGVNGKYVYDNTKKKKAKSAATRKNSWQPEFEIPYTVSGVPRWIEGARYYLQWAGMPSSVYSPSHFSNDYTDDYKGRGLWVNYLAGGSRSLPGEKGLNIPIDLSFAFHTDAGTKTDNSVVGTLGIYYTKANKGKLGDGSSTTESRDLSTSIYNTIIDDVSRIIEPEWRGRKCVDREYFEAATPRVPAMLLELMSHESFAEMRYGQDPRFKFVVSRAIYKGMLRYMNRRYGTEYVVQPLPVNQFAATLADGNKVRLSWQPVEDQLETTAHAERYVVYRRIGDNGFDNGVVVDTTEYTCDIPTDKVVSFKVTALNRGGQSMPSETLSVGISSNATTAPVLVINGFDRLSAPDEYVSADNKQAGFLADKDNGVEDGDKLDYVGAQKEFNRDVPWTDDDAPGHGSCTGEYEYEVIAGNSFDYPAVHGRSILHAGSSFVSVSRSYVNSMGDSLWLSPAEYPTVDLILGKQKQSRMGRPGLHQLEFKTFDDGLQRLITDYCHNGGRIFVSGAYVASDLWKNSLTSPLNDDKDFARKTLKYKWLEDQASVGGKARSVASPLSTGIMNFEYHNKPNGESYAVESPDAIEPASKAAMVAFRYDNGKPAGIVFGGDATDQWKTVVLGFPFESIKDSTVRDNIMKNIITYFNKK